MTKNASYHGRQGANESELDAAVGFIFEALDARADAAYDSLKKREQEIEDTRLYIRSAVEDAKRRVRYVGDLVAASNELDVQIQRAREEMLEAFKQAVNPPQKLLEEGVSAEAAPESKENLT